MPACALCASETLLMSKQLYQKTIPLDRVQHAKLQVATLEKPYAFAHALHIVPAAITEFGLASRDMPIVFVADGKEIAPALILGPKVGTSAFMSDGNWTARYVPAYLRRYPFLSATSPDGQEVICFDPDCEALVPSGGRPLFEETGEPSELLQRALALVDSYLADMKASFAFTQELKRLDLLQGVEAEIVNAAGVKAKVDGVMAVNEAKFNALPDAEFMFLRKAGYLGLIQTHLLSLANVGDLARAL
jgi:hypothetical protein